MSKNRANLGYINNLKEVLLSRQVQVVSQDHAQHLFFNLGGDMGKERTKAMVEMLNHNACHKLGFPAIYPTGRICKDCGAKLSVYNGMDTCNPCWVKKNVPDMDTEFNFQVECACLREMAVAL